MPFLYTRMSCLVRSLSIPASSAHSSFLSCSSSVTSNDGLHRLLREPHSFFLGENRDLLLFAEHSRSTSDQIIKFFEQGTRTFATASHRRLCDIPTFTPSVRVTLPPRVVAEALQPTEGSGRLP